MNKFKHLIGRPSLSGIYAAITASLALAPMVAANAQEAEDDDSPNVFEEIIVTGTTGGGEMRRIEPNGVLSLSPTYLLFLEFASPDQAARVVNPIQDEFLAPGG